MATRSTARTSLFAILFCSACLPLASAAEGETVVQLLQALRAQGANIIFSSDLVDPALRAPPGPVGADLWTRVRGTLAVYGLELRDLGGGRYAVTRSATAPPPSASSTAVAPAADPSPLQEVSVYASRYEMGRDPLAEPRRLSASQIETTPGSRNDALRAVRVVPGVATNTSTRPYIRGSFLDDVLVQFDGVSLADPFHLKNFQSLISAFDPEAVERIQIFSGGFPVRYGTRSGGVIDIEPRALSSGYENTVGASLLAYNVASVGTAESLPVDWLVTARHSVPDVVLKPVNGQEGEPKFMDSLGRLRWHTPGGSTLTVGWLLLDDQIDLSTDARDEVVQAKYRDEYAWVAWDAALSDRLRSRTTLSGTWARRSRTGVFDSPGFALEQLAEQRNFSSGDLHNQWTYQSGTAQWWELGLEAMRARAHLVYARRGAFDPAVAAGFNRPVDNSRLATAAPELRTYAASISARQRWSTFEAEAGLRLDSQDYERIGLRRQWSPRINLRYDFAGRWRAYASWGRFTQAQRVDEWRTEADQKVPDAPALALHSVLGLSFEGSRHWRLGAEVYRKRWSSVTPYFDNLFTTLSLLPDLQPDRALLTPASAEAAGIELSARRKLSETLEIWASYAYSHVADDLVGARDVPRSWDQPHAFNSGLSWRDGRWSASLLLSWHSGWPRSRFRERASSQSYVDFDPAARNQQRWGDFFAVDLSAGWTRSLAGGDLSLWMDLTNGTDRENPCCSHLRVGPTPESVPAIDENAWMPLTLNLGVTWRFRGGQAPP